MPTCEVNGATLDYGDTGGENKPVLVLLHGWLGTWDSEFGPEIEWLRPHFRVLAPSRRGYGRSGPKPRKYTRKFYQRDAEDIVAWLDALGVDQVHIVGYSDGGEVALLLPILQPGLVRSVATWGAVGYFPPDIRAHVQSYWPPTWVSDELRTLHGADYIEGMILSWITAVKQIIDSGGNVSRDQAHAITCRLLMMLGRHDPLNPEQAGRQLVERAPNARLVMFNCGHPVHREKPDAFRRTLWAHLEDVT
ncbi:MAG: alpha/beta hydrolase [Chloroflexi bacterium]|nr:alpha/beta hydrolase [Chloroflexota bacterium]